MNFQSILFILALSFNQPKLCPNASWNPNATTFADNNTVGISPRALFINRNNTIFMARFDNGRVLIWRNASANLTTTIVANLSSPGSLFVTNDEQIFVDGGSSGNQIDRWTSNGTRLSSPMPSCSTRCYGMFVDVMDNLYCSQYDKHQVLRRSLLVESSAVTIVAGTGCSGSTTDTLSSPLGIFVTIDLDLYVADCGNDRVQFFRSGQMNGTTLVGNVANGTIALNCPSGIVLDADGYLFIVDQGNHRIVGSGPSGFRCLVGCSGQGSASHQLSSPWMMSFDRDGNIFVTDTDNNRIQKFLLSSNSCGESSRVDSKYFIVVSTRWRSVQNGFRGVYVLDRIDRLRRLCVSEWKR